MTEEVEYILGTDSEEIHRLRVQHAAWQEHLASLCARAGLAPGDSVLDLGCGPGFTSFDLAQLVGPTGKVLALDISPRFLDFLARERDRLGVVQIDVLEGSADDVDLPPATFAFAYTRWLLCWLEHPERVLAAVADALQPGGVFVVQEYLDWGSLKLVPRDADFDRGVEACLASWPAGGATIDICDHLPTLAKEAGFDVESFRPVSRLGPVDSPEWRWVIGFLRSYLPKLVERGLIDEAGRDAALVVMDEREAAGAGYILGPTMADLVLRKPRA